MLMVIGTTVSTSMVTSPNFREEEERVLLFSVNLYRTNWLQNQGKKILHSREVMDREDTVKGVRVDTVKGVGVDTGQRDQVDMTRVIKEGTSDREAMDKEDVQEVPAEEVALVTVDILNPGVGILIHPILIKGND